MIPLKTHHELLAIIDSSFDVLFSAGKKVPQIAMDSGLSQTTIRNLVTFKTKYPRAQTVLALARAAGYRIIPQRISNRGPGKIRILSA
jgi:DNA-binding phage protein